MKLWSDHPVSAEGGLWELWSLEKISNRQHLLDRSSGGWPWVSGPPAPLALASHGPFSPAAGTYPLLTHDSSLKPFSLRKGGITLSHNTCSLRCFYTIKGF